MWRDDLSSGNTYHGAIRNLDNGLGLGNPHAPVLKRSRHDTKAAWFLTLSFACLATIGLLGRAAPPSQDGQAAQAPPTDTVAPDIPGVVKGGTKIQVIKDGFEDTEGPIALPDGSLVFTETQASRLTKIDKDGNTSTFLEGTNGSNGLAFDSKGRLYSAQTTPGAMKVGIIYPQGQ